MTYTVDKEKIEKAKQELREYRENIKYIKEKQEDLEELRENLVNTTKRLSPTKTSNNSMSADNFSDKLDRIAEIEKEIDRKLEELLVKKFIIDEKIDKLEYPYRDVLFMRYARCKSWDNIARELGYSVRDIYRKHGIALVKYANL